MKILTLALAVNVLALNVWTVLSHMRKAPAERLLMSELNLLMEEKFVTEHKSYSKRFRSIGKRLDILEKPLPIKKIELETGPAIRLH
tara:strand:+ start:36 stop:296 length:261 start_codon:yes stop_codon:yes gene_type:complete